MTDTKRRHPQLICPHCGRYDHPRGPEYQVGSCASGAAITQAEWDRRAKSARSNTLSKEPK